MSLPQRPLTLWLSTLAYRLLRDQADILAQWQARVDARKERSELAQLSLAEFCDHIPDFLDRLSGVFLGEDPAAPMRLAAKHGAHRWQHGANIRVVTQEWGVLHRVLIDHIAAVKPEPGVDVTAVQGAAYRLLADEIHQAITASLEEFHARQRVEADARLRDLEAALDRRDQRDRYGRHLDGVSHDLRGSLKVLQMSYESLKTERSGDEVVTAVGHATENISQLLRDLRDLARLDAGRETRCVEAFDAAKLLNDLCQSLRPLAEAEGLALVAQGTRSLPVQGDPAKVRRIAQTLILNALKHMPEGEVQVGWESVAARRWLFYVRDTRGLRDSTAGRLADSLEEAETREGKVHPGVAPHLCDLPAASPEHNGSASDGADAVDGRGEGIGLAIVHHLCELLNAVLEVESERNLGVIFRVLLPKQYPPG